MDVTCRRIAKQCPARLVRSSLVPVVPVSTHRAFMTDRKPSVVLYARYAPSMHPRIRYITYRESGVQGACPPPSSWASSLSVACAPCHSQTAATLYPDQAISTTPRLSRERTAQARRKLFLAGSSSIEKANPTCHAANASSGVRSSPGAWMYPSRPGPPGFGLVCTTRLWVRARVRVRVSVRPSVSVSVSVRVRVRLHDPPVVLCWPVGLGRE